MDVAEPAHVISAPQPGLSGVFVTVTGTGQLLGYARVSTTEQNADLQSDELRAAGCYQVYVDQASRVLDRRPELAEVVEALRPGDTLVVWRLDRLGRCGI